MTLKSTIAAALAATMIAGMAMPAQAQISERTIRVSNGVAEDHPVGDGVAAMQQCFDERTGGAWTLNAFWSSALGDDLQATQALRSGTQEMVVTSTSPIVGIVPALGVFDLPFLFANEQEADAVLDGEFGQYISDMMPEANLINLAFWENGFRNLTNSVRPVESLEDFEGMRVRVMQNNIFLDTFQTLGTNATPMAFGEVFTALETGAIDAQENPYVTIDTSQFYEVQDYLSNTRHAYTPFMVLFSKPIWDSYSAEEQQILVECAEIGRDVQREASRALSDESLARIQEAGMQVNDIPEEEMAEIREAVQGVYERNAETIGQEVIDRMMAALEEVRAQ
ncbi:TRAP transporter substrate-binding protein [Pelagibacterium sp. 26DY04]|uniref:TRAP transporter substrate-binding protein n=1 Tax=Pelagibacterium sp. 26DY04 TaxID=2967130 RepID=UPI002815D303|nr:TRAP transporter substrate-binding protein [Pelagibacterium sp. 26DY04]WMT86663.1 TRAP transporter substrate-binding protein [Pelagibacterium sp. 26DY04]